MKRNEECVLKSSENRRLVPGISAARAEIIICSWRLSRCAPKWCRNVLCSSRHWLAGHLLYLTYKSSKIGASSLRFLLHMWKEITCACRFNRWCGGGGAWDVEGCCSAEKIRLFGNDMTCRCEMWLRWDHLRSLALSSGWRHPAVFSGRGGRDVVSWFLPF